MSSLRGEITMSDNQTQGWPSTGPRPFYVPSYSESQAEAAAQAHLNFAQELRVEVMPPEPQAAPRGHVAPIVEGIQARYEGLAAHVVVSEPPSHIAPRDVTFEEVAPFLLSPMMMFA